MRVLMAGGGTAGHVFPAIAVADRLRDGHDADVTFVGSTNGQEASRVPEAGYAFEAVRVDPAQTRASLRSLRAVGLALVAANTCRPLVRRADVVVGIGGYASAPAILAAGLMRTPLVLIEPNSVPGMVNRVASRWARAVATTFAGTAARLPRAHRIERTGTPVRPSLAAVRQTRASRAEEARARFGLEASRRTVVVFGGSLGARHLDEVLAGTIGMLRARGDLQLLVATGPQHLSIVTDAAAESGDLLVRAFGFIERMDLALAVADLAVSRAGAGSIADLTVCGVPSILVPYPHATEHHQDANARELVAAGAAELLEDRGLTASGLGGRILELMGEDQTRAQMAAAAEAWGRPDADARVAALVAEVAAEETAEETG